MKTLTMLALVFASATACARPHTTRRTYVEHLPNGETRRVTVTTTRRVVEPKAPPPRPEDPVPADARIRHNLSELNKYRRRAGLAPLLYDARISSFAMAGSRQLASDHEAHAHFHENIEKSTAFGSRCAENQGDPRGVPPLSEDASESAVKQIDIMLKMMFDEGPGGGHYDNMMNPKFRRVGIGLHWVHGTLYMTNDFSD